jgi:hypothetical protein
MCCYGWAAWVSIRLALWGIKDMAEQRTEVVKRQSVGTATLAEIIESEFAKSLGRSVADLMPRVRIRASDGCPNWDVTIGTARLATLGAFNEAMSRVQAAYDLDEQSHRRLRFGVPH